jgi:ribosomal protein S18 acetylase RimI-like enzyme
MLFTAPAMAHRLEHAEAQHLARQIALYARLYPGRNAQALPVAGGIAIATDPTFGRKLNHAIGLGLGTPVTADDIDRIEALYVPHGLASEIDLCPHAAPGAVAVLAGRGYRVDGFSNVLGRDLADELPAAPPDIEVLRVDAALAERFIAANVTGFSVQAHTRPAELLEVLARIALGRDDSTLYLALIDGEAAGSAGMALIETPLGPVAHFYIASTLPAYRGRGIQAALLRARLIDARQAGLDLASVSVRPANTSGRNAERAGFRLAYTQTTLKRVV